LRGTAFAALDSSWRRRHIKNNGGRYEYCWRRDMPTSRPGSVCSAKRAAAWRQRASATRLIIVNIMVARVACRMSGLLNERRGRLVNKNHRQCCGMATSIKSMAAMG